MRLAFDPAHRFVNPVLYRREEAEACWARVDVPTLLLAGKDFKEESLQGWVRDARVIRLPGVGHMMHHEDPAAVAAAILGFVPQ